MFIRSLVLILLVLSPYVAVAQDRFWTQAMGVAPISGDNIVQARRHALAEALIVAGMAGGSDVRGVSMLDKARIIHDKIIMRPTGRVHEYHVIEDRRNGKYWQMTLRALVGPDGDGLCAQDQSFVVNAKMPVVQVAPNVPAWADPLGNDIANLVVAEIDKHENFRLGQILTTNDLRPMSQHRRGFDYTALTQGVRATDNSDHLLQTQIKISYLSDSAQGGKYIQAEIGLWLDATDRPMQRAKIARSVQIEQSALLKPVTGSYRRSSYNSIKQALANDLMTELSRMSCQPPVAVARYRDGVLRVNLGRNHGLDQDYLGFISGFSNSLYPFVIKSLSDTGSEISVLGPAQDLAAFDGQSVSFLRARLP